MGTLRLLLAFAILANHTGLPKPFGPQVAVRLFFILSGFYMALVLDKKYPPTRSGIRTFYQNRLLRLYPPYLIALLFGLAVAIAFSHGGQGYYSGFFDRWTQADLLTRTIVCLSQVTALGQDGLLFLASDGRGHAYLTSHFLHEQTPVWRLTLDPPAWSLSTELAFYCVAPWFARFSTKALFGASLAFILFRLAMGGIVPLVEDPWVYRFFPFELGTFLAGMLSYRLYRRFKEELASHQNLAFIAASSLLVMAALQKLPLAPIWVPYLLVPIAPLLFHVFNKTKSDRTLGELSYPLYIIHWPVIGLVAALQLPHGSLVTALLSFLCAWFLLKFVDEPIDRFRQANARRIQPKPDMAMLLLTRAPVGVSPETTFVEHPAIELPRS